MTFTWDTNVVAAVLAGVTILVQFVSLVVFLVKTNGKASDAFAMAEKAQQQVALVLGRVDLVEDRATRIETNMQHLPDKDQHTHLALQVAEMRSDIRALSARIVTLSEVLSSRVGHD